MNIVTGPMTPTPLDKLPPGRPLGEEWHLNARAYAGAARSVASFRKHMKYLPNIALPVTFHEKMFWWRMFDRDPAFIRYCDKLACRRLFEALDPPVALPRLLWTGRRPEDLPDELVRPGVIVKLNAGCRQNWFFSRDGVDRAGFERACRGWLARPYGRKHRQWGYAGVERMLFAEEEIACDRMTMDELKVHLFGGRVYYSVNYREEKTPTSKSAIFDASGNRLDFTTSLAKYRPERRLSAGHRVPDCYGEALAAAEAIAAGSDYLRVDFMVADGVLYGGEVTVYPSAGLMTVSDSAIMRDMARAWDLRKSWFLKTPQHGVLARYRERLAVFVERERASHAARTQVESL